MRSLVLFMLVCRSADQTSKAARATRTREAKGNVSSQLPCLETFSITMTDENLSIAAWGSLIRYDPVTQVLSKVPFSVEAREVNHPSSGYRGDQSQHLCCVVRRVIPRLKTCEALSGYGMPRFPEKGGRSAFVEILATSTAGHIVQRQCRNMSILLRSLCTLQSPFCFVVSVLIPKPIPQFIFLLYNLGRQVTSDPEEDKQRPLPTERVDRNDEYEPVDEFGVGEEIERLGGRQ